MNNGTLKIKDDLAIVELLIANELYKQACQFLWYAVRSSMFHYLDNKNLHYFSTREALQLIINEFKEQEVSSFIVLIETIGTLCEWDDYFSINEIEINDLKHKSELIIDLIKKENDGD